MPLRSSRLGRAAVVTAAVTPGPSPVAKAAVVGAAVSGPGRSPVATAAVIGAAAGPGPSPVAKAAVVGAAGSELMWLDNSPTGRVWAVTTRQVDDATVSRLSLVGQEAPPAP